MGGAKHLARIDGRPMLARVIDAIRASRFELAAVVLAPDDGPGRELVISLGAPWVCAEDAHEGRAASVRAAVRAAPSDAAGLLVALADQPFLTEDDLDRLADAFARTMRGIVRASYAGEPGSPVLFGREHFDELLALSGRAGGREVVAAHEGAVVPIEIDPAHGRDIDRPEDLSRPGQR
jgi:molybdenum cofactor cytidylyltransferase